MCEDNTITFLVQMGLARHESVATASPKLALSVFLPALNLVRSCCSTHCIPPSLLHFILLSTPPCWQHCSRHSVPLSCFHFLIIPSLAGLSIPDCSWPLVTSLFHRICPCCRNAALKVPLFRFKFCSTNYQLLLDQDSIQATRLK